MGTKHTEKTKTQLINEVRKLKQRLAELETKNVGHTPANTTAGNGHLFDLLSWDIFPHPVMVICKDKRVVAANEFACRAGAVVGEHCSRCCGLRDDGPDEDVECIKNGDPSSANRCAFCLVDKAFETQCPANIPEITVSGKIWNVLWVPLDDDLCLCYAIDITAWKRIERDALQSDAVLEAVAFMVHEFAVSNRWEDTINVSLARLGEAMNVSRVCVFENHEGEGGKPLTSLRYEWVAQGIEPCAGRPDFMNIPLRDDKMECHASILSQGDIIRTNVRELPTSEQSAFLGRDVMSVVLLPIFVSNRWWGFVKIDVCKAERDWSDVVINVLRTGADVIGLAIERANAVETLARSEERYALAQQSAHIGAWDYDLVTGHIEWSSTIEPMFGLARGEFGGTYVDFLKCVYPDDLQYVMDAVNAALECAERTRKYDIEHRILRPDGTVRWVAETAKILRDKSGNAVRMIGTVQDITRRKEMEEQLDKFVKLQKMRLREINHRVENTLSSIISMLNMKKDRAQSDGMIPIIEPLESLIGRIRGLAAAHKMLTGNGWQPLELSQLCEQIIGGALTSATLPQTVQFSVTPSPVKISSGQANHLALVLNELTTNSVKHALGERDTVQVDVTISEINGQVIIQFRDDGPGYPPEMVNGDFSRASVGFELITGIVTHSLAGEIQIENDNGAVTIIRFKKEVD